MCFFCSTVTFSLLHCIAELILVLIDTLSNQVLNWFFFVFEIIYGNICMFDLFLFLKRIGFLYIFFSHALKSINNRITVLPLKEMRFFFLLFHSTGTSSIANFAFRYTSDLGFICLLTLFRVQNHKSSGFFKNAATHSFERVSVWFYYLLSFYW